MRRQYDRNGWKEKKEGRRKGSAPALSLVRGIEAFSNDDVLNQQAFALTDFRTSARPLLLPDGALQPPARRTCFGGRARTAALGQPALTYAGLGGDPRPPCHRPQLQKPPAWDGWPRLAGAQVTERLRPGLGYSSPRSAALDWRKGPDLPAKRTLQRAWPFARTRTADLDHDAGEAKSLYGVPHTQMAPDSRKYRSDSRRTGLVVARWSRRNRLLTRSALGQRAVERIWAPGLPTDVAVEFSDAARTQLGRGVRTDTGVRHLAHQRIEEEEEAATTVGELQRRPGSSVRRWCSRPGAGAANRRPRK